MMRYIYIIAGALFICIQSVEAQSSISSSSKMMDLSTKLEEEKSDDVIAAGYEELAKDFASKGAYDKAEDYYSRAKKLYEKLNNKEKIAAVDREIAKMQEAQGKLVEAKSSYEKAAKKTQSKDMQSLNMNDLKRLKSVKNPKSQAEFISSNISLSKQMNRVDESQFALQNMAANSLAQNDTLAALGSLEEAKNIADNPVEELNFSNQIAEVYKQSNQTEKLIEANKEAVEVAKKIADPQVQVEQLKILSSSYSEAKDTDAAIETLKEAYNIAIEGNDTRQAKSTVQQLAAKYVDQREQKKAIKLYADFANRLDTLLAGDTTLIDAKFVEVQEKRISQLEKERELKDELIDKQNLINYALITVIILILLFIIFIIRSLYSITQKNKKIALQSLRREMNPHFIFNSLNSINQFISQNDELEANKYLTAYSRLMRTSMENSNKDFIPLSIEVEHLREYLELEVLRFRDKFSYSISINDDIDTDSILVPNMLIQPQLENAIWHGLRYKDEKGILQLSVDQHEETIIIRIEDDGIGLTQSQELKTKHQKTHNSRGLTNSYERISLLNSLYKTKIEMTITEKSGTGQSGVLVIIQFPLKLRS